MTELVGSYWSKSCLRKVGFQQQLIDLIMFCVTSAKLSVRVFYTSEGTSTG